MIRKEHALEARQLKAKENINKTSKARKGSRSRAMNYMGQLKGKEKKRHKKGQSNSN